MTHLLINQNVNLRREYLVDKVNGYLGTEFEKFAQLHGNPDIHIVEFTEGESIKIEDVKQLQKELIFQPFKEKYQLGIICYAHNMTVEAQNAMLKSLEEQGEKTIYFLLVGSEGGLLDTIVSRCVKHYVKMGNGKHITAEDHYSKSIFSDNLYSTIVEVNQMVDTGDHVSLIENLAHEVKELYRSGKSFEYLAAIRELEIAQKSLSSNANDKLAIERIVIKLHKLMSNL